MYTVSKKIEIAGAHKLSLPYNSPCSRLHGHNWLIEVEISCKALNASGMVIDFKELKKAMEKVIKTPLDHQHLNFVLQMENPTAERMAKWVADVLEKELWENSDVEPTPFVSKVIVQESEGNRACYIP